MRSSLRNVLLLLLGFIKAPKPGIHIINAHYVTPEVAKTGNAVIFDRFLKQLSEKCILISLEKATDLIVQKKTAAKKALVALTFDDGFEECYTVIAPLLEKYNCRGAFFINANYIESGLVYQKEFNERTKTCNKKPMTWQQVKALHQRGHLIGSHTLDHVNMAELNEEEIEYQLTKNKKILEEKLGYTCDHFAWTYGQLQHFSDLALQLTSKYHRYIYSGTNYKKYFSMNGMVINRRHVEPFWPKNYINYFLSVEKK